MKDVIYNIEFQGGPIIDKCYLDYESENLVGIMIDLKSKNCDYSCSFSNICSSINLHISGIDIEATEDSLYLNEEAEFNDTRILFPEYNGWDVYAHSQGRYHILVILRKNVDELSK